MIDIEGQLFAVKFIENTKTALGCSDDKPPKQRRLIKVIMMLPGTSLKDELHRRNAAINCGHGLQQNRGRRSVSAKSSTKTVQERRGCCKSQDIRRCSYFGSGQSAEKGKAFSV